MIYGVAFKQKGVLVFKKEFATEAERTAYLGRTTQPISITADYTIEYYVLKNVEQFYVPSSITLVAGTLSSGDISSIITAQDGNEYHLDEVAATPGFDVRFNFTGITSMRGLIARIYYNGLASHEVVLDLYNYVKADYDTWLQIETSTGFNYYHIILPNPTDYFDGSGNAIARLIHTSNGNNAHDIHIDYLGFIF